MIILRTIFISVLFLSFIKSSYSFDLTEINRLSTILTKDHKINLKLDGKELPLNQKISIEYCNINLDTFSDYGLILHDTYDLTEFRPMLNVKKFKGLHGLFFGVLSDWKKRSKLYYETKEEREEDFQAFKELYSLCSQKDAKKIIEEMRPKNEEDQPPIFVGRLPERKGHTAGKVYGEDTHNYTAPMEGETSLYERLDAIKNAKESIFQQNFDFTGDRVGRYIADELSKKREEGLDVRVIVDGMGYRVYQQQDKGRDNTIIMYNNLMAAGIRVFGYSCSQNALINEARGADFTKLFRRNHEKMFVIDSGLPVDAPTTLSIIGGANLAAQYFRIPGKGKLSWREFDILIKGDIIPEIRSAFLRNYREKEIRYIPYDQDHLCLNPYNPVTENRAYNIFKSQHTKEFIPLTKDADLKFEDITYQNLEYLKDGLRFDFENEGNYIPIDQPLFSKTTGIRFLVNRPEEKENYILQAYLDLINSATESINIGNQFFIPDASIKDALLKAAQRGVKINILTNSTETNKELEIATIIGRYHYIDLVYPNHNEDNWDNLDINIYEWQGKREGDTEQSFGRLHAKYMTIDSKVALVGSHNLDYSSLKNSESLILLEEDHTVSQLNDWYNKDLEYSHKITKEEMIWYRKPKGKYLIKLGFAKLIEKFL